MNSRNALYLRSIRGPVILVTIGSLFAIQQAGGITFGRTWPILIIVIGIMKLLERSALPAEAQPTGYYRPPVPPNPAGAHRAGQAPAYGYAPPPPPAAPQQAPSSPSGPASSSEGQDQQL